ncbi:MASE1 domain-containing protein [Streptomyces sp. INA 01156]
MTPVLLAIHHFRGPLRWSRWKEAAGLLVVTVCLVPLVTRIGISMLFLIHPLLLWAALRFQLIGSSLCALFASVMATVAATDRAGPFQGLAREEVMIGLQAFNGTVALPSLLLSAVITEQLDTRRSVERACQELVEVLEHLTAGESAPAGPSWTGAERSGPRSTRTGTNAVRASGPRDAARESGARESAAPAPRGPRSPAQ